MDISIDGNPILHINEWEEFLLKSYIPEEIYLKDIQRRILAGIMIPITKAVVCKKDTFQQILRDKDITSFSPTPKGLILQIEHYSPELNIPSLTNNLSRSFQINNSEFTSFPSSYIQMALFFFAKNGLTESNFGIQQIQWAIGEKIKGCLRRLHQEWEALLMQEDINIGNSEEEFVGAVLAHPSYQSASTRMSAIDKGYLLNLCTDQLQDLLSYEN